jgi:hypothetical protein
MDKKVIKVTNNKSQTKRVTKVGKDAEEPKPSNEKQGKKQQEAKEGPDGQNNSNAPNSAVPKKPIGEKNTLEHRLDYVCNFLNIKKEQTKEQETLDFCLDDICRMDWITHFSNLKVLVLINQNISMIEGIDKLRILEKCWLTNN